MRCGSDGKQSTCNAEGLGSIPGWGRSPGEGNDYPLQYSCLENSPWTEEPGGLQSMGSQRVRCYCATHTFTSFQWYMVLSHMIICHLYIFFGGVSIQIFCPFLSWIICFLVWLLRVLCIFWIQVIYQICVLPVFLPSLFSSVQLLSRVRFFATPWITAHQASLSITNSQSPPKPMSIQSVMPSSHLILCCPLLLLPSIFPSIRVFSNESALHIRWPKYWSFSFNISPSNEHPGLISFRMDWLDLLAVEGTLKSLLQHYSSKASILRCSAFFTVCGLSFYPLLTSIAVQKFLISFFFFF